MQQIQTPVEHQTIWICLQEVIVWRYRMSRFVEDSCTFCRSCQQFRYRVSSVSYTWNIENYQKSWFRKRGDKNSREKRVITYRRCKIFGFYFFKSYTNIDRVLGSPSDSLWYMDQILREDSYRTIRKIFWRRNSLGLQVYKTCVFDQEHVKDCLTPLRKLMLPFLMNALLLLKANQKVWSNSFQKKG